MRRYKNETDFNPSEPWRLPAPKSFSTQQMYVPTKSLMRDKLYNAKKDKHQDHFSGVKNMNQILHLLGSKEGGSPEVY
jgi:hypothetical protein